MYQGSLTKLLMIAVMVVHSLFGCVFHAFHLGCCQAEEACHHGSHHQSCSCNRCATCLQKNKNKESHGYHHHGKHQSAQHDEPADNDDHAGCSHSHHVPLGFPCDCQCKSDCSEFVASAAKINLVNRISVLPVSLNNNRVSDYSSSLLDFSLSNSHCFGASGLLDCRCAMIQVWRL